MVLTDETFIPFAVTTELPFQSRISRCYATLSPNARKIADYLQQNPLAVLGESVAEIADITQTSKASVSRFFRQLGYESHHDAKLELKALRSAGLPLELEPSKEGAIEQQIKMIKQTWQQLDTTQLEHIAQRICQARKIVFIGYRNSYPIAMHFRQQIQQVRMQTLLLPLPGQSLGEDLTELSPQDFVIVIGFRRRPSHFSQLIKQLSPYPTFLLTDTSGQIYSQQVEYLLTCQLGQEQALDSYAAPHTIISAICNQVFSHLGDQAKHRVLNISNKYADLSELDKT